MQEYYDNPAVSQSQLKTLLIHPKAFREERESSLYFEEKEHFTIGSAVDFCLTQPDKEFSEVYHVSKLQNKPSDTIKSIINQVFDICVKEFSIENLVNIHAYYNIILNCCDNHNYQNRWNEQTRVNKICEHYEYWEDLKTSYGKTILSQEEKNAIDTIVMFLRTSEYTSVYFNAKDIRYQVPIYFECEGVDCKALLDMVIFDHELKTVQPIDIKTLGDNTLNFPKSVRRRRYDIQAAFYIEALKYMLSLYYSDYRILPFIFLVESTTNPGEPLVFRCTPSLISIGEQGRPQLYLKGEIADKTGVSDVEYSRLPKILGFRQLLNLYKHYLKNGFNKDRQIESNSGSFLLDWSGIVE